MVKSITQLVKEGYSRNMLKQVCHMPNTPFFRINENGKFYVEETKLAEFLKKVTR